MAIIAMNTLRPSANIYRYSYRLTPLLLDPSLKKNPSLGSGLALQLQLTSTNDKALFEQLAIILKHHEVPLPRHHFIRLGKLEGHDVLGRSGHQFLHHDELVMVRTLRGDHTWREVQQSQWRIIGHLAGQAVTHADLGAEVGRDHRAGFDRLIAAGQYPVASLKILIVAGENAVLGRPLDPHLGPGQAACQQAGRQCSENAVMHGSLLVMDGASL